MYSSTWYEKSTRIDKSFQHIKRRVVNEEFCLKLFSKAIDLSPSSPRILNLRHSAGSKNVVDALLTSCPLLSSLYTAMIRTTPCTISSPRKEDYYQAMQ